MSYTQDELDRLPFRQLPRRRCDKCREVMVIYEVGQRTHPICSSRENDG